MDIDSGSPIIDLTNQPDTSSRFNSDPPLGPRAPQYEDGKYGFLNESAPRNNSRPFARGGTRGGYGRLASDSMMRGEQYNGRRSNW